MYDFFYLNLSLWHTIFAVSVVAYFTLLFKILLNMGVGWGGVMLFLSRVNFVLHSLPQSSELSLHHFFSEVRLAAMDTRLKKIRSSHFIIDSQGRCR